MNEKMNWCCFRLHLCTYWTSCQITAKKNWIQQRFRQIQSQRFCSRYIFSEKIASVEISAWDVIFIMIVSRRAFCHLSVTIRQWWTALKTCRLVRNQTSDAVSLLGQHRRWWPSSEKALEQRSWDLSVTQLTRDIEPLLVQWWSNVYDTGPTLNQQWPNVSCLLGRVCCDQAIIISPILSDQALTLLPHAVVMSPFLI